MPEAQSFQRATSSTSTTCLRENARIRKEGGEEAKADAVAMGITEVSLSRKSFLSAASFQHTTRILINSAVRGSQDNLVGPYGERHYRPFDSCRYRLQGKP